MSFSGISHVEHVVLCRVFLHLSEPWQTEPPRRSKQRKGEQHPGTGADVRQGGGSLVRAARARALSVWEADDEEGAGSDTLAAEGDAEASTTHEGSGCSGQASESTCYQRGWIAIQHAVPRKAAGLSRHRQPQRRRAPLPSPQSHTS